jgi:peptidoglycan/LPS O-acetylase OafA/YrhL
MTQTAPGPALHTKSAVSLPIERGRLSFIDGLRGVAMLSVLLYHCWVHTIRSPIALSAGGRHLDLTAPLHYGYLGVNLFLLLSGFCLTYPLAGRGQAQFRLDLGRFFRRRARRILPPYYIALAAFALLPTVERGVRAALGADVSEVPHVTAGQVVTHLLMVHNFSLAWMGAINASFWTLALEWQLYMLFPVLVWGFRRWGPGRTLAAVLAITLCYRTWVYRTQDIHRLEIGYIYAYSLPGRMFEFVLGMLAALLLAGLEGTPERRWVLRYLIGAVTLGGVGLLLSHLWTPFSPVTDVIWGLAFFCLVMYGGGRSAAGRGWLDARPLVSLGLISYSVYLIHEPLIVRGYAAVQTVHRSSVFTLLLFELAVAPLLIGIGWLYFRCVEVRFLSKRSTASSGPG